MLYLVNWLFVAFLAYGFGINALAFIGSPVAVYGVPAVISLLLSVPILLVLFNIRGAFRSCVVYSVLLIGGAAFAIWTRGFTLGMLLYLLYPINAYYLKHPYKPIL